MNSAWDATASLRSIGHDAQFEPSDVAQLDVIFLQLSRRTTRAKRELRPGGRSVHSITVRRRRSWLEGGLVDDASLHARRARVKDILLALIQLALRR